jgi:hypothetical protein
MKVLHGKFLANHPEHSVSRASFYRFRPQHVVKPTLADRQQCLCQQCDNLDRLVEGMRAVRLVSCNDKHKLLLDVICSEETDACLSSQCPICRDRSPIVADVAASQPQVEFGE